MRKPILYLLAPGFEGRGFVEKGNREYCPECAEMWGLLAYFPAIKEALDIRYMPIEKPRTEMVDLLGVDNQNCPTLVLHEEPPEGVKTQALNDHIFINNVRDIGVYFAKVYGTPYPRGH